MTAAATTVEKLFVQIFERKNWIIQQVKQQTDLYNQHLASKLLIDGITPPSWLWKDNQSSSAPKELNKEDLISEILLPHPQPINRFPGGGCSLYNKPAGEEEKGERVGGICTETYSNNKCFDTGNEQDFDSRGVESDTRCDINAVPEFDIGVTSPHDETEVKISSIFSAQDQSVARIQRSKSRQKALELRNSASRESRSRSNQQNNPAGSLSNRLFTSSLVEDQVTILKELGEYGHTNCESCEFLEIHEGDKENNNEGGSFNSWAGKLSGSRSCDKQKSSTKDLVKGDSSSYKFKKNGCNGVEDREGDRRCSEVLNSSREVINSDVSARSGGFIEMTSNEDCSSLMEKNSETFREMISRPSGFLDESQERDLPDESEAVDGIIAKSSGNSAQLLDDDSDLPTEHSVGLVHDGVRSQAMSGGEGMPNLLDASILSNNTDMESISGAKPQLAKHDVWNGSHGQVIYPSLDTNDATNQLGKFETVASEVTLNDQPTSSRLISCDASLNCLGTRSSDYLGFMEPKQLVFDEREECNLRDKSNLIVEYGRLVNSPDEMFDASLNPPSSDHDTNSGNMIPQKLSSVELRVSTKAEKVGACSLDMNIQEHDDAQIKAKGSNLYEYSVLKNITFDSEAVPHVPNSKFSCLMDIMEPNVNEGPSTENHANLCGEEVCESELHNEAGFRSKESTRDSHTPKSKLFISSNISCSIEEMGTLGPTDTLVGPDGQCSVEEDQNLSDLGTKPCSGYASNMSSTQQVLESSSLAVNDLLTCSLIGSPLTGSEILDLSESRELQISKKSVAQNLTSFKVDSWPRSKRRKIQEKETDCFSASPSFRVKRHYPSQMDGASFKRVGVNTETVLVIASPVNESSQRAAYQNMACQSTEEMKSSIKLQTEELAFTSEDLDECAAAPSTSSPNQVGDPEILNLKYGPARCSRGCLGDEMKLAGARADATEDNDQDDNLHWLHLKGKGNLANGEAMMVERSHLHGKFDLVSDGHLWGGLGWCFPRRDLDLIVTDQTMPVLEGFIVDPPIEHEVSVPGHGINFDELKLPRSSIERASILEQICTSTIAQTPLPQLSSALKLNESNKFCHSVPNGLLECMDLRNISSFKEDVQKQVKVSYMHGADSKPLQEMSHSDSLPCLGARFGWYSRNLSTSPIEKLWERLSQHTGNSEKRLSSNPEFTCFPIEENPIFTEENENASELTEKIQEDNNSLVDTSANRESLADITEENACSVVEKSVNRASVDSITTEVIFKGTYKKGKPKRQSYAREGKENDVLRIAVNSVKKAKGSTTNRFRKTSSSCKISLKRDVHKPSEEPKRNNIVSNVTSFIPLVQQKQAAAVCTGKRDVKVKALEIAEATKRLEVKKENERKMRKEALKVERARMEQENLRQIELNKKMKEVERKKREADVAAKKRHREEEERKEKERKRKRIEESRRMKREEGTLCSQKIKKEKQLCAIDKRELKTKESENQSQKSHNLVKEIRDGMTVPNVSTFKAEISPENCATSGDSFEHAKANAFDQEKSYEISPYQCTDDEDDDDDEVEEGRNQKFIPSWASKNSVALVLPLQQGVQPGLIFPRESFCRIDEVCASVKGRRIENMKGQRQQF